MTDASAPPGRLLSNGRYTVLVTAGGGGFSTCAGYALTAWSADRTSDGEGFFVYLRDRDSGDVWSAGARPIPGGDCRAEAADGGIVLGRRAHGIESELAIVVADGDCELRRLTLRNRSGKARSIEVTSYAEVVLNDPAARASHPAFDKLFVQTEAAPSPAALLARRRPRSAGERHPWMVHALFGDGGFEFETDRARFLGRGRTRADAAALRRPLSGTQGSVLDPVFSIRRVVTLEPDGAAEVTLLLGMAPERAAALALAERYQAPGERAAAFASAAARQATLGLAPGVVARAQTLAVAMLYGDGAVRAPAALGDGVTASWEDLGPFGVGRGGLIALVALATPASVGVLDELARLLAYWKAHGLAVRPLIDAADEAVRSQVAKHLAGDDTWVQLPATLTPLDRARLAVRADLFVPGALPALADRWSDGAVPAGSAPASAAVRVTDPAASAPPDLREWNGYGGFAADGREYVIRLVSDAAGELGLPPMPWTNVVANPNCGFLVSERGAAHTWARNSREHRLTPWSNDPVLDPHGEALYLRDRESGACWSPQGGPLPAAGVVEVAHGLGYTRWRHHAHDLDHDVVAFVPQRPADPVKLTIVRLTNRGTARRQLRLIAYTRLVLGGGPEVEGRWVRTTIDAGGHVVRAVQPLAGEFASGVTFAAVAAPPGATTRATADRTAFLGAGGSERNPLAVLGGHDLDGRAGVGLDACAALQVDLTVPAGATVTCVFVLGEGQDAAAAEALLARYRAPGAAEAALADVGAFWDEVAGAVTVATPLPAIDHMVNGWLVYQAAVCRLWGRSAFYQSGGAFGFRDQLQDAAALVHARPEWTRAQIVLHAGHQFVEGDVLHWWHPPVDRGLRTRFADDLLWLPFVTASYVAATGDLSVLDEPAPFLTARALAPGEDESYLAPTRSGEVADVYAHCCRALDRSLAIGVGAHGIPLMGTGDWNDGMNRVGREGRGESVWMAFFLHRVLADFEPLCAGRGDRDRLERYRAHRAALVRAIEEGAWDGAWYRRAYYDDGTPLGAAVNDECRIDVLAQAWAQLSGAAPAERVAAALDAAERLLVSERDGIIRLLTPPFDRDPHDPGYIKGYIPGIRENGGQYTHAALWMVQALAEAGRRERAAPLLAMLSPVSHTRTPAGVAVYQVEPYVVAADVYGVAPHVGRGGWTWYTGSAGWMLRVALESVLGVRFHGATLTVRPRIPDGWPGFTVRLRLPGGSTVYEVAVRNIAGSAAVVRSVEVDGAAGDVVDGAARISLARDGRVHRVAVTLGAAA